MSVAIDKEVLLRGETLELGVGPGPKAIAAGFVFDGSEEAYFDLKRAESGSRVPQQSDPVILNLTATFVPATADQPALYAVSMTAQQSDTLEPGAYITDGRFVLADGFQFSTFPIVIEVCEVVSKVPAHG